METKDIYVAEQRIDQCEGCGRFDDTRMNHCFNCAEIQTIILEGTDMNDKGLNGEETPAKTSLEKVKLLHQKFNITPKEN